MSSTAKIICDDTKIVNNNGQLVKLSTLNKIVFRNDTFYEIYPETITRQSSNETNKKLYLRAGDIANKYTITYNRYSADTIDNKITYHAQLYSILNDCYPYIIGLMYITVY